MMEPSTKKVGEVITELRSRRRLARPDVARRVGVTSNYLGMVEAGKRTLSMAALEKLAEVFEVPVAFITCLGTPDPKPSEPQYRFKRLLKATQKAMLAAIEEDQASRMETK